MKKSKYPKIVPKIRKDKLGNPKEVYLEHDVYQSILDEIKELEEKISKLKNKQSKPSKLKNSTQKQLKK